MRLGEDIAVTLFGESHGAVVGALVEGIPAGVAVDAESLAKDLSQRKPGGEFASKRREDDACHILSGVNEGFTTGWPILLIIANKDAHSSDYSFLPNHPRPGHADLPELARTSGYSDLRGGGANSARLTAGLVAASNLCRPIEQTSSWQVEAHVHSIGDVVSTGIETLPFGEGEAWDRIRCRDAEAGAKMIELLEQMKNAKDSIGSTVELRISGLPLGFGEPWFEGLEPALANALMAIPAARAIEFGRGTNASKMRGSEHNDSWHATSDGPIPVGEKADGALGGMATGADIIVKLHFKPPSSISQEQDTLNIDSGEVETLFVTGRHDPVIAPRAVAVVESVARLVLSDLSVKGGWSQDE
ncbi:MAG TPA: chorismate synthase [Candidatus Thalassarchaeaceae archaeon]|jgi:chorismate synthase|nr:chorismate synthase [Candidatus Thalassarchaeaceae archaeon]